MATTEEDPVYHLHEGDVYEGYRVIRRIGHGGYGQVYLVRDARNRTGALKLFLPAPAMDRRDLERNRVAAQRFLLEAAILESIKHTHVVRCERHGQAADGSLWLLLEYLPGNTFRRELQVCEMGYMPMERVLRLGLQLAGALLVIHGHGVVHRDIKPDNLILLPGDILKVLDFGVAKAKGAAASFRTTTGVHFGTSLYMAPDRLLSRSGTASPLWDLYAAGLTLWEARAGQHPFVLDGEELTDLQVIHKQLGRKSIPSLAEITGDDPEVCEPIMRACAPDVRDRYRSAAEMIEGLERALERERALGTERVDVLGKDVTGRTRALITHAITEPVLGPLPGTEPGAAPEAPGMARAAPAAEVARSITTPLRSPAGEAAGAGGSPRWTRTEPMELPPEVAARVRPAAPSSPDPREVAQLTTRGTQRIATAAGAAAPGRASAGGSSPGERREPSSGEEAAPAGGAVSREGEARGAPSAREVPRVAPAPAPNALRELGRAEMTEHERGMVAGLAPLDQRYRLLFSRYLETLPPGVHVDLDLIGDAIAAHLEALEGAQGTGQVEGGAGGRSDGGPRSAGARSMRFAGGMPPRVWALLVLVLVVGLFFGVGLSRARDWLVGGSVAGPAARPVTAPGTAAPPAQGPASAPGPMGTSASPEPSASASPASRPP